MQEQKDFIMKPDKTPEEQAAYNMQLMKSLGAETMDEAMEIIQAAGIRPEDLPELMMDSAYPQPEI